MKQGTKQKEYCATEKIHSACTSGILNAIPHLREDQVELEQMWKRFCTKKTAFSSLQKRQPKCTVREAYE